MPTSWYQGRVCAEQFRHDGSIVSSIVRTSEVMAAEFSRELSAKVHAGQLRQLLWFPEGRALA